MPEIIIVSDAVDGTSVDLDDEDVDVPEETAELVSATTDRRGAVYGEFSPGTHLGAHTDRR